MPDALTSLHGRKLGLTKENALVSNGLLVTSPCVDASITVAAEVGDARAITIQLKDSTGKAIVYREIIEAYVFADAAAAAFATTGGSTGIAIGASGAALAVVAKKMFILTSTTAGVIALTWTDTGTETAYLGLRLPSGRLVISSALTNA
ncbi:hypothetical protein [Pseudomonas brassicacearum]|uniref:hypothetical protein n=1 Tax=Pseudomonas brassicacearum TaxID=930166 RepID=UPI000760B9B4|nr:hypothetical protein [Pseudomonas brassicacearum]